MTGEIGWPPCRSSPSGSRCDESLDPRKAGRCSRCGMVLPRAPRPVRRNLRLEREVTEEAARGAVDPSRLIEHSEARALSLSADYVSDPMHIRPGRDRLLDAREEAADARNHLLFWMQENLGHPCTQDVMIALRFFALAYDRLTGLEEA